MSVVLAALLAGCGGGHPSAGSQRVTAPLTPASAPSRPAILTAPSVPPAQVTSPPITTVGSGPDPGLLAQTGERPSASGEQFYAAVLGLWRAIVTDEPGAGRGFFFPQAAYRQVKDIADPDGDYQNRLLGNYTADIHQLHSQLGPNAKSATFIDIDVPSAGAEWIEPGTEYNKGSYWRVYDSRIRYSVNGQQSSFAVSSLISWRGQWYVVHLSSIR